MFSAGLTKGAIPKGQRRVKSQVFDSFSHLPRSRRRISAPGLCMNFDPLMEGEESQTREIMASAGGMRMSIRRSYMEGDGEDGSLDENEEWAKIAAILSSCGGRMSATEYCDYDDFERRLQKIFAQEKRGRLMQSVGDWLEGLGLPQYENTLVANGFDDTDFLGPNVLEKSDLLEMGITNEHHRDIILKASSQIAPLQSIAEGTTPASVAEWLESLRLCDYLEAFLTNNFTTMERLRNISELDLNYVLDITTLGHRKRILASLRVPPDVESVSQSDDFIDFTKEWRELRADQTEELANLNLYKDYTNVRPISQHREDEYQTHDDEEEELCELCQQQLNGIQLEDSSQVQIRPPSTSSAENVGVKQWRHQPEVLIKGCCNYTVQYLGSTLVKSLQGTESTRESIHKMKKSSDSIAKVPSVVLSVSYRGVKFIDARSKHVICEHDISNIFCACQDGENLNYFAYITRDHVTECHYCHVFCVRSTELATEIILTLGEAFEVAYQVAIRERVLDSAGTHQVSAPSEASLVENGRDDMRGAEAGTSDS